MKLQKLSYLVLFVLLIHLGCRQKNKGDDVPPAPDVTIGTNTDKDSIVNIEARYFNYTFTSKAMYTWDMVQDNPPDLTQHKPTGVLVSQITDSKLTDQIYQQIKTLVPADTNYIPDNRIALTIHYKSGKEDRLAISHTYADRIYMNDTLQKPNNRLLYLLKNSIGYYTWMIGDDLQYMQELKDNSFVKEPFVKDSYYKEWETRHTQNSL